MALGEVVTVHRLKGTLESSQSGILKEWRTGEEGQAGLPLSFSHLLPPPLQVGQNKDVGQVENSLCEGPRSFQLWRQQEALWQGAGEGGPSRAGKPGGNGGEGKVSCSPRPTEEVPGPEAEPGPETSIDPPENGPELLGN